MDTHLYIPKTPNVHPEINHLESQAEILARRRQQLIDNDTKYEERLDAAEKAYLAAKKIRDDIVLAHAELAKNCAEIDEKIEKILALRDKALEDERIVQVLVARRQVRKIEAWEKEQERKKAKREVKKKNGKNRRQ